MTPQLKWLCVSTSTCFASFLSYAVPVLQVIALGISIYAGIRALRKK